jgi:AraC family transcriptional regulator
MQSTVLHTFSGALLKRTIDRSHAQVPEHAHDWPVLSLFVMGAYSNHTEIGSEFIAGPSATLYRAGVPHRNAVGADGFEQIEVQFDPSWLGYSWLPPVPVLRCTGGSVAAATRTLVRSCVGLRDEDQVRTALREFLQLAVDDSQPKSAGWIANITRRLREDTSLRIADLAHELGRHPSWLGTAYCHCTGEGILEAAARFRVERAARLLRETDLTYIAVADDTGFCDQSHMARTFRRILGRPPSTVRAERLGLRQVLGCL